MGRQVPDKLKRERYHELMKVQQEISSDLHQQKIGKQMRVMIEERQEGEDSIFLARSEYDAPEVDGVVYVHSSHPFQPGDFVKVKITDAMEYDLIGEPV